MDDPVYAKLYAYPALPKHEKKDTINFAMLPTRAPQEGPVNIVASERVALNRQGKVSTPL